MAELFFCQLYKIGLRRWTMDHRPWTMVYPAASFKRVHEAEYGRNIPAAVAHGDEETIGGSRRLNLCKIPIQTRSAASKKTYNRSI